MAWRVARSLDVLRAQINTMAPQRDKSSDGTIGDAAHSSRASDHNPNAAGVVCALDITHDPKNGVDAGKLAETLRLSKDRRIKYIISNARIASSKTSPWVWRPYAGTNAHRKHFHISVMADPKLYDDTSPWSLAFGVPLPRPQPPVPMPKPNLRRQMAKAIIDFEARRDSQGRLAVYKLPANDGGGTYEVAGINNRYHQVQVDKLVLLINAGMHEEAELSVADYLAAYTDVAASWSRVPGIQFFLRDCVFNRGPTGAARILQMALGVIDDGKVGPETRKAIAKAEADPPRMLSSLRAARERYERVVAGRNETSNLWRGLVNRWNKAEAAARRFGLASPSGMAGTAILASASAAAVIGASAIQAGMPWWAALLIGAVVACVIWAMWKNRSTGDAT